MDDASGSALLLDVAASLHAHPEKLGRSLLFVFVTGEEKGLLGSRFFATRPTVPAKSIVADVNVDMFLPIVPLKFLEVKGLEESDLGDRAAAVAASLGVKAIPDQEPLRNRFIRSDQYSFTSDTPHPVLAERPCWRPNPAPSPSSHFGSPATPQSRPLRWAWDAENRASF